MLLRGVPFPIDAAEGWPARIGGSASRADALTEITIRHNDTTDLDPSAGAQHELA